MDYKIYQEERKALIRKQEQLNNERKALDKKFAEEHPWNAYKGKKVRIKYRDGRYSDVFFFHCVGECDQTCVQIVGFDVKKDGNRSLRVHNFYTRHDSTIEEVEA